MMKGESVTVSVTDSITIYMNSLSEKQVNIRHSS